ncbi:hypothetical protein H0H93_013506 [Arthromyces matolae]|nr:hypothetical protein H0H93_013506 [Arthromyces matolae]
MSSNKPPYNHNITQQQTASKDRERRILQLTIDEINQIEGDINLYKGVGKMFMQVPRKTMETELKTQEKELADDISNLNKKSKYLEKQLNDAQSQLRDIFTVDPETYLVLPPIPSPPMASTSSNKNSTLLKDEGNAFFKNKQYPDAYTKYSEAIKQDPKNAVLWANRAACSLSMKKYLDAVTDAEKATQLDPKYAKAWGRQASAYLELGTWHQSVEAFKKALSCLKPIGELSAVEKILKTQFEEGLNKAQGHIDNPRDFDHIALPAGSPAQDELPWKRAMAMEETLIARRDVTSSEWMESLDAMNRMEVKMVDGKQALVGRTGVIAILSNAILRDTRVFHIADRDFFDKYNKQMMLEIQMTKAWTTGGPRLVKEEAVKRLKTLGWGAVRPALAVTVRAWIMRGYFQSSFQQPGATTEYISDALQILDWGSRLWKNVSKDDRGAIFEASFARGVKRLYLNLLLQSYSNGKCDLEDIASLAREIIDEKAEPATGEVDPGFISSFWVYPLAEAHVMLGWYYLRKAAAASNVDEGIDLCKEAALQYLKGANLLPRDDEKHVMYLKVGLEAHWFAKSPLKITLPIAKQIREAIPVMKQIWRGSPDAPGIEKQLKMALDFEEDCTSAVAAGTIDLEGVGVPDGMPPLPEK